MIPRRRRWSRRWAAGLGFGAGACVGMTLAGGRSGQRPRRADGRTARNRARAARRAAHAAVCSCEQGSRVTLRYDVVCQADSFGKPCALEGNLFVRRAGETAYRQTPLAPAGESGLETAVDVQAEGLSYYAVIEDGAGSSMTVPAGGAVAPQRAWAVPELTSVNLGVHVFGRARKPDRPCARRCLGIRQRRFRPHHRSRDGAHRPVGLRRRSRRHGGRARPGERSAGEVRSRLRAKLRSDLVCGRRGRPCARCGRYGVRPRPGAGACRPQLRGVGCASLP